MKCAIHQPQFLPWAGYLHKIGAADVFVFLDNVQYKKNEFQNRNKLRVGGAAQWVTVPVSFRFGDTIRQARVAADVPWRRKLRHTVEMNYRKAPFYDRYAPPLFALVDRAWDSLADINEATVRWLLDVFELHRDLRVASAMPPFSSDPTGRLIEICRHVGADTYLSGAGGKGYLDEAQFARAGLRLEYQAFAPPVYPQHKLRGDEPDFIPYLSALDGLLNCGGGAAGRRALGLE